MKRTFLRMLAAAVQLMLNHSPGWGQEITVNWRQKIDSGSVWDLKFMPNLEEFVVGTDYNFQIRDCEDGNIIKSYPFGVYKFEFSTDKSKFFILPTGVSSRIQIRKVENMDIIYEYILEKDLEGFTITFNEIVIDPVRPLIYVLWSKEKGIFENYIHYRKILIFNSETLEPVGELTSKEDEELLLVNIAVSKDGKYLASMNDGMSKLMVWSLDTRQKIVDEFIATATDKFSEPSDIKFSELNSDKIYFTGGFYKQNNENILDGLCEFSIKENRIIDSTFAVKDLKIGNLFSFFENESKILATNGVYIYILNLIEKIKEFEKFNLSNDGIIAHHAKYNPINKYFLAGYSIYIDKFQYQPNTSVTEDNPKVVIYPNPTSGMINISLNCINLNKYEIFKIDGKIINSTKLIQIENNLLSIDFSKYTAGVYFLKIYCGNVVTQYKVIKEN